jgi:hypothetical protein
MLSDRDITPNQEALPAWPACQLELGDKQEFLSAKQSPASKQFPSVPSIFPAKAPPRNTRAARPKTNIITTPVYLFSLAHPEEFPPLLSRFIPAQRYPFARTPNLCSPDRIRLFPALTQPAPWHSLLLHFHRQYSSTAPTTLICLPWCRSLRCKAGCYLSQIACPSQ